MKVICHIGMFVAGTVEIEFEPGEVGVTVRHLQPVNFSSSPAFMSKDPIGQELQKDLSVYAIHELLTERQRVFASEVRETAQRHETQFNEPNGGAQA